MSRILEGINVLVTAGPTIEEIDPVHYISNHSSGKQGNEIANAFAENSANVTMIMGPTNLEVSEKIKLLRIKSAIEMHQACLEHIENHDVDVMVAVAAVSDFRIENYMRQKINKSHTDEKLILTLVKNPDTLYSIGTHSTKRPKIVIGFALESEDLIEKAEHKRVQKNCNWIIANSTRNLPFYSDMNSVFLIKEQVIKEFANKTKKEIAKMIVYEVIKELGR